MHNVFKIQNKDGLFSKGGVDLHFNKIGKIWTQQRFLSSHLTQTVNRRYPPRIVAYDDCDVVEYTLVEFKRTPMAHLLDERRARKIENEQKRKVYFDKLSRNRRFQQYKLLKKEFEDNE